MRSDLDALMQSGNLDAILVIGNADHNPPMYYLTGGGHISSAALVRKQDGESVLFCNDMERDEAAKTGLKIIPFSSYNYEDLLKEAGGDFVLASALRFKCMLSDLGLHGRIGLYGKTDLGMAYSVFTTLQKIMPEVELVGETGNDSILLKAMETKDSGELERIRRMGRVTTEVVRRTAEYLTSRHVRADEVLLKEDGAPLTIADVKAKINLWIAELGAENPEGTIFAIGRDSAVPHSAGNPDDLLRLGRTIVFDIYPCEAGGGYFYDFTRTWSLGYATPEAQDLHDQVRAVYDQLRKEFVLNAPLRDYQRLTCELFEKNGHQTPLHTTSPVEGYVHSLAHGVGLNIHERPWSGLTSSEDNILKPGVVFTSEPGLYYPDKGMGVRIEDTYTVHPDGMFEVLADYPYDFVLKMMAND
jgi:Xaa-Pro aminopeptidase